MTRAAVTALRNQNTDCWNHPRSEKDGKGRQSNQGVIALADRMCPRKDVRKACKVQGEDSSLLRKHHHFRKQHMQSR